jgi:glycosyltransferase involved in cell wall biosynthesis
MRERILFDLSIAGLGYSGIPQDTRCTFHALATETPLTMQGLLYTNTGDRTTFAALPRPRAQQWKNLWMQAQYMTALIDTSGPETIPEYIARKLRLLLMHRLSLVKLSAIDTDAFWDLLWRGFFSKSLPATDRRSLSGLAYFASNLSIEAIARKKYPWSRRFTLPSGAADVLITPDARPVRLRGRTVKISRHHDIIPLMAPDLIGDARRFVDRYMRCLKECVLNGDYFACNSYATEADLLRLFPQVEGRTFVAHCIVGAGLYPDRPVHPEARIRQIIQLRRSAALDQVSSASQPAEFARTPPVGRPLRYVLTVSALDPKKNHIGMLRAFRAVNQELGGEYRLIVVGSAGWNQEGILRAMRPMSDAGDLILLESVPLGELRLLYSCADSFLFPSFYEGFGLPPVEAMKCGTPVVASDIETLREVLGSHAHYCDPYSVPSIKQAIISSLHESELDRIARTTAARLHVETAYSPKRIADIWARNIRSILDKGRPCES